MLHLTTAQKRAFLLQEKRMCLRELPRERLLYVMDLLLETVSEDVPDEVILEEFEEIHRPHLDDLNAAIYDYEDPE